MSNNGSIVHISSLSLRKWKQEDIAKLCLFLLSDDVSFIIGENIWINGGRL